MEKIVDQKYKSLSQISLCTHELLMGKLLIGSLLVCLGLLSCAQPTRVNTRPDGTIIKIRLKDCRFMGFKRTIGIDIEVFAEKLGKASGKLGISSSEVREMDELLRDYAAKYEASCRDFVMGVISDAEYNCRRDNMDKALDQIRVINTILTQLPKVKDPSSQAQIVQEALNLYLELACADYRKDCGPGMEVEPRKIIFANKWPERFFEIINPGNREFTYAIVNLLEAFKPTPRSGKISAGESATVGITRQNFYVEPGKAVPFLVKNNYNEEVRAEIYVSSENAQLFDRWGAEVSNLAKARNLLPNLEDSLAVIDKGIPKLTNESTRYMLAGNILLNVENFKEAELAFQQAVKMDSTILNDPSSQLVFGVLEYKQNHPEVALDHFEEAAALSWPEDTQIRASAELFSGSLLASQGHKEAAAKHFQVTGVYEKAKKESILRRFLEKLFRLPNLLLLITDIKKDKKKF